MELVTKLNFASSIQSFADSKANELQRFADIVGAQEALQIAEGAEEKATIMKIYNGKSFEGSTNRGLAFKAILEVLATAHTSEDGVYKASMVKGGKTYTVGIGIKDGKSVCYDSQFFTAGTL